MADISYFEAWSVWFDGRSTIGSELLGLPMIWWGRFGKILSFVSGASVVVDLIGPERLSRYGDRLIRFVGRRGAFLPGAVAGAVTAAVVLAITEVAGTGWWLRAAVGLVLGTAAGSLVMQVGQAVRRPEFPSATRWMSLALFVVGFHFDLLAS
ncbi:hypothetical protein MF672_017065 [Actinomadura sp. ATCC 31491]|uniref:Uncharacterized protein n=1 Tax=Actinomadura luzonensis TaxID=2805427 RepID=A0ABT0FT12_9ACTN|nr:hypothetical protein [Actinomadura luzonensis]MCK2215486.1 hypothetical protein [Actinomadura luzonensis]